MEAVENLQGHENVAGWAMGVDEINFLHNHYHVPHLVVQEVNPEVVAIFGPPPAVLDKAPYRPACFGERYPVDLGVLLWWIFILLGEPTNPMLVLPLCCQRHRLQF